MYGWQEELVPGEERQDPCQDLKGNRFGMHFRHLGTVANVTVGVRSDIHLNLRPAPVEAKGLNCLSQGLQTTAWSLYLKLDFKHSNFLALAAGC